MQTQKEAEEASGRVIESSGALQALPLEAIGGLSGCFLTLLAEPIFGPRSSVLFRGRRDPGGRLRHRDAGGARCARSQSRGLREGGQPRGRVSSPLQPRDLLSEPRTCGGVSEPDARASDVA